jgi:hypothetical protein
VHRARGGTKGNEVDCICAMFSRPNRGGTAWRGEAPACGAPRRGTRNRWRGQRRIRRQRGGTKATRWTSISAMFSRQTTWGHQPRSEAAEWRSKQSEREKAHEVAQGRQRYHCGTSHCATSSAQRGGGGAATTAAGRLTRLRRGGRCNTAQAAEKRHESRRQQYKRRQRQVRPERNGSQRKQRGQAGNNGTTNGPRARNCTRGKQKPGRSRHGQTTTS